MATVNGTEIGVTGKTCSVHVHIECDKVLNASARNHNFVTYVAYLISKLNKTNEFYLTWEFLHFGLTEKALFQVILGLLLVYV